MTDTTYVIPALKPVYAGLSGLSEALLRVATGYSQPPSNQKNPLLI